MADEIPSIEIARVDGPNSRSIRLRTETDGALVMDAQDMGPLVKEIFDDSDYEFWVRVGRDAMARLAFELLKDKYAGRADAVDDLRAYCTARGIAHEFETWA